MNNSLSGEPADIPDPILSHSNLGNIMSNEEIPKLQENPEKTESQRSPEMDADDEAHEEDELLDSDNQNHSDYLSPMEVDEDSQEMHEKQSESLTADQLQKNNLARTFSEI